MILIFLSKDVVAFLLELASQVTKYKIWRDKEIGQTDKQQN